jgi:hypothetical protein
MLSVDFEKYQTLLKAVASMSRLYSDSEKPYLNPRFIEKLFVYTASAEDFARKDMSFDAKTQSGAGVGVKTFVAQSFSGAKTEKVAEFTRDATRGDFAELTKEELAYKVAELRNARVMSDARVYEVKMEDSFYHCLVRSANSAVIHEEPYSLIDLDKFRLVSGKDAAGNPRFTDGRNFYTFSTAKNTLFKTFELGKHQNSQVIEVRFINDIFEKLLAGAYGLVVPGGADDLALEDAASAVQPYVILPLYSSENGEVMEKSGINQWNAEGRERKFGEAYIPHPKDIRKLHPNFFPPKDQPFTLRLPDGSEMQAKVCQQGGKAIMTKPNHLLLDWLFKMIDDTPEISKARLRDRKPYKTADLQRIGKDSVRITLIDADAKIYKLEPSSIGSYESYLESQQEELNS